MNAALLHTGHVTHVRHVAPLYRFGYRIWMLSVDLDRLDAVAAGSRVLRHNAAGLVSLQDRDHGPRDGSPWRPWVEAALAGSHLRRYAARIRFMLIPRVLGYAFNPIAFFFCHDQDGVLGAVLHQVKNTFGGQHAYVLPVAPGDVIRQDVAKQMHVSPFFDMQGGYRFAFNAPDFARADGRFALRLRYGTADAPRMTAIMRLQAQPLTDLALLRQLAAMPLMPVSVMAAIHWQALKLWLRGARYHKPPPGVPA